MREGLRSSIMALMMGRLLLGKVPIKIMGTG